MFLVQSGAVILEAYEPEDGAAAAETVREGEVIGWSWLFRPFTWHLRARALEPTKVIVLNQRTRGLAAAEQHHDFGYELMKRVAQVVVCRQQATRKQLLDLENEVALNG